MMADTLDSADGTAFLQRLVDNFIKPNAESLAGIVYRRRIAVLVGPNVSAEGESALRSLGWDGTATVFEMSNTAARRMAHACAHDFGDAVTHDWLTRPGKRKFARVLVFTGAGTLLMNFTPSLGWHLEPGSTDAARAQAMN